MTWKVTYRNSEGRHSHEFIEADNRSALFRVLSERNIQAIRVEDVTGVKKNSTDGKLRRLLPVAFCLGVVALLTIFFFVSKNEGHDIKRVETKRVIKDTARPVVRQQKTVVSNKIESVIEPKKSRPTKVGEIVNNYIKLPSGRLHYIKGERTNTSSRVKRDWFRVFENRSDNEIALILTLEPGETVVGTPVYRGGFKKEFLESLKTPIKIEPDDTEAIKDLKKAVSEARKELMSAIERGEDIDELMRDARNQFQDLATYRQQLESEVRTAMKSIESEKDFDDLMAAANEMLSQKGIAPGSLNSLSRLKLKFMLNQKKGNQK